MATCNYCGSKRVLYINLPAHSEGSAVLCGVKGILPPTEITPYGDAVDMSVCMDCLKLQLDGPMAKCELETCWDDQVRELVKQTLTLSDGSIITCCRAFVDDEMETFMWNGKEWRTISSTYDYNITTFDQVWPVARPMMISNRCWHHVNLLYTIPEGLHILEPQSQSLRVGDYRGGRPTEDGCWYFGY